MRTDRVTCFSATLGGEICGSSIQSQSSTRRVHKYVRYVDVACLNLYLSQFLSNDIILKWKLQLILRIQLDWLVANFGPT